MYNSRPASCLWQLESVYEDIIIIGIFFAEAFWKVVLLIKVLLKKRWW